MTNTDRRYGVSDALAWKAPVRAAATGNIALSGEQAIDGVACVEGDRVLVWQQVAGRENGIYVVSTGNWRRAADADGPRDLATGTMLVVTGGLELSVGDLSARDDRRHRDRRHAADVSAAVGCRSRGSFRATSATSLPISVGAKTFAVEANRAFTAGDYVIAKSEANANNFMVGQVTSYSGTTLVVDVEATGGSGTHADWSIAISGSPGAAGRPARRAGRPRGQRHRRVPGLAAALDAKLDDSQAGAVGLNVLAATTQAAGRAAINAADNNDPRLLHRRVAAAVQPHCPMGPSYHPAFVMGDGSVTVTGQNVDSLAQGANVQVNLFPQVVVLPEGLLGTPVDVIVGHNRLYILTDQGDVCAAGYNVEGQLGDNSTTTRTVAVLLNASDIGPRSAGGASRAITKIETTGT